jgi:hypothetical protein
MGRSARNCSTCDKIERYRVGRLTDVRRLEFAPGSVADVKYFDPPQFRKYTENHPINVRLIPVEQVPEVAPPRRERAAVGPLLQTENGLLQAPVPFQGSTDMFTVNLRI